MTRATNTRLAPRTVLRADKPQRGDGTKEWARWRGRSCQEKKGEVDKGDHPEAEGQLPREEDTEAIMPDAPADMPAASDNAPATPHDPSPAEGAREIPELDAAAEPELREQSAAPEALVQNVEGGGAPGGTVHGGGCIPREQYRHSKPSTAS